MMFRSSRMSGLLALTLAISPGCTNLIARRAVVNFSEGLDTQNIEQLKVAASSRFEHRALRQQEALKDLKRLKIPQGYAHVMSVEKVEEGVKLATVRFGDDENAKSAQFRLVFDLESHRWVVDDVLLGESGVDAEFARSVADQMDLLLTCREVLEDWQSAPRSVKLQHCTNELHAELSTLPPAWFKHLTEETVGTDRSMAFRPDARRNGDGAVLAVPHHGGNLFLEFKKVQEGWKVHNMTFEPKADSKEVSRSLMADAQKLNQATRFLTAFTENDLEKIEKSASPNFYSQSLLNGDLNSVRVPLSALLAAEYQATTTEDRTELILDAGESSFMLTLKSFDIRGEDGATPVTETRVDEVTIFEADGAEVKRVSALMLSNSVAELFIGALRSRNLQQIRSMSSNDFNERVWNTEAAKHFAIMPYPELGDGDPEIISTDFRGDVTEMTLAIDDQPMTLVMRLGDGWMVVDDVLIPAHDRPISLKANLELVLPIKAFATAIHQNNVEEVAKHSAAGMNQIVWKQLNYIPEFSRELVRPLLSEVVRITPGDGWMVVHTTDGMISSEIKIVRENGRYLVHDVSLIHEASPTRQFVFLQNVRQMIAAGQLLPKGANRQVIMQASHAAPDHVPVQAAEVPPEYSDIQQAGGFEPISPDVYR